MDLLNLDDELIEVLVKATSDGLEMAHVRAHPVGASRYIITRHEVSAIIGFVGSYCGSVSINMSAPAAQNLAGRILQETYTSINTEVLDGICEILNIISGKLKAILSQSDYRIEKISVPSVVVGTNYYVSHYRGMSTLSVEFELPDAQTNPGMDYIMTVSISMMQV